MRSHLKGQTYAEFALCAVVVLILIFGVVNFSLVVYAYNFVSYAAREGARFAAVHGSSNPPPAHSADITNLISAEGYGLNGGNLKVSTTWSPNNQPGSVGRGAGSIYFQLHDSVRYTTASESNQQLTNDDFLLVSPFGSYICRAQYVNGCAALCARVQETKPSYAMGWCFPLHARCLRFDLLR